MSHWLCVIIALSLLPIATSQAANVRNYFTTPTNSAVLDTNYLIITKISTNILSSGGITPVGLPVRAASSPATNALARGFYSVTSPRINGSYVINIDFDDNSSTVYDYTNYLHSGYNTYVSRSVSSNEVVSALGYVPASGSAENAVNATNLYPAAPLSVDFLGGTLTSGNATMSASGFAVNGGGAFTPNGFAGNGSGLTNVSALLATNTPAGWPVFYTPTTLYVSTSGDDSTANRTNSLTSPFRTPAAAVSNALAWDTILVGEGGFNISNAMLLPKYSTFIGSGRSATFLTNCVIGNSVIPGIAITASDGSRVGLFTGIDATRGVNSGSQYGAMWGAYENVDDAPFKDATLFGAYILGSSDCVYVEHNTPCSGKIIDCELDSDWDTTMFKAFTGLTTRSPHHFSIQNSFIHGTHGGGFSGHDTYGVACNSAGMQMELVNTIINMTNTSGKSYGINAGTVSDVAVRMYGGTVLSYSTSHGYTNSASADGALDNQYIYFYGVQPPQESLIQPDYSEGLIVTPQGVSYASRFIGSGAQLTDIVSGLNTNIFTTNTISTTYPTNIGAMVYVWSNGVVTLTTNNAGTGGLLHRGPSVGGIASTPPYWAAVNLGTETSGQVDSTTQVLWGQDDIDLGGFGFNNGTFSGVHYIDSAAPANASAAGTAGTITWDANYIYICISANTWRRISHATW